MKHNYKSVTSLMLCSALATTFTTSALAKEETSITIYSKSGVGSIQPHLYRPIIGQYYAPNYNQIPGYAMVRSIKDMDLKRGRSTYNLSDVAAYIDPTTVSFKSLTNPKGTTVLEQNFMFDLVSLNKLAERYVGKQISFEKNKSGDKPDITIEGTLISALNGQLVVEQDNGNIVSTHANSVTFPKLPEGFFSKPTLVWDIENSKAGKHNVEISYQTDGITWWADYNAVYSEGKNANEGYLDLGAWVSILNKSGGSYKDTKLKLVAGDVNKVQPAYGGRVARKMAYTEADEVGFSSPSQGFKEKSFFEFHLYTLGRKTSIPENSTKQVELFPKATKIPVDKKLVYYGADKNTRYYGGVNNSRNYGTKSNKKVDVYLEFKNEKEKGLGIPLPKGKLRVSKLDTDDGSLEFIGEDNIDHTPKDEKVLIKLGSAFDVVGERKQMDFVVNHNRKYMDETYEITLRNHKDESVDVIVKEPLYRSANWKIYNSSTSYNKINSNTVEFPITIPKDGTKKISYMVRYTWK